MKIKDSFLLDPVSRLLYFEEELRIPNRKIEDRVSLISQYDKVFVDISEVANNIPSRYMLPLLNGIEMSIRDDISRRKEQYKLEIKKRKNKSLKNYSLESL